MHPPSPDFSTRRAFLKRSGQLAITGTALPLAMNLAAMGEAAAFNAPNGDYKALVCVFLYGANDYANTVVTYDNASYDKYSAIRGGGAGRSAGGIALAQSDLTATLLAPNTAPVDALGVARQYALNPAMTGLAGLFNAGRAAVLAGQSEDLPENVDERDRHQEGEADRGLVAEEIGEAFR